MRWIYLSPHLDDAVLSAGGWIYELTQSGNTVEIWTFMCGFPPPHELSPFAQALHQQWGMTSAEEVVRGRRLEDVNAAKILGAQAVHFDFLDCIYRRGKSGEWLYSDVFVEPHAEDAEYADGIAKAISARLKPDDQLFCQFSIGKHVDHVLTRRAAELLGHPLHYVADIPYLFNYPQHLDPNRTGMKETAHAVSEAGVTHWQDAIEAYTSQMSMLFPSPEAMRTQIAEYSAQNSGVRLWTRE
ncbi:MAG: PIG-L family deacetylase [Anaerolineales bacterium]